MYGMPQPPFFSQYSWTALIHLMSDAKESRFEFARETPARMPSLSFSVESSSSGAVALIMPSWNMRGRISSAVS